MSAPPLDVTRVPLDKIMDLCQRDDAICVGCEHETCEGYYPDSWQAECECCGAHLLCSGYELLLRHPASIDPNWKETP